MNIRFVITFLEIVETGNFSLAAERLGITQTAATMRIKAMEEELGRRLFNRQKGRVELTAAGIQFLRHAEVMVTTWRRALQEVGLPPGVDSILSLGAEESLWDTLLLDVLITFRKMHPEVAVRSEVASAQWIGREIAEGLLDFGVVYTPVVRPNVNVEVLGTQTLILVSTVPRSVMTWSPDYIYTDWGSGFRELHSSTYQDKITPTVTGNLGPRMLRYMLAFGGSGYFPFTLVRSLIEDGTLHIVRNAPRFVRNIHCLIQAGDGGGHLEEILSLLRAAVARSEEALAPE
ncbi:LysR family transcriptional regulator [Xanthobacter sp. VNH20]|uniref:LysR family transcriptional regulator n=1 Tax=Xanthobacter sp. VNH20 TaxID=3156616 RepID=UPI0032B62988